MLSGFSRFASKRPSDKYGISHSGVSDATDRTRERIFSLSADDVTQDEIETTDAVLAGLAYQYATGQSSHVAILVSDTLAERAIDDVLGAMGAGDQTAVVEGRTFLNDQLGGQFD